MSTNHSEQQDFEAGSSFDIKEWLFRILSIWPWIIVSLAICLGIAYFKLRSTEPIYMAKAVVLIKDEMKGGGVGMDNYVLQQMGVGGYGVLLENEIEVLKSYDLMAEVVKTNQLYVTVKHEGRISQHTLYGNDLSFVWEFANPDTIEHTLHWSLFKKGSSWMLQTATAGKASALEMGKWYSINGLKCRLWPNIAVNGSSATDAWGRYEIIISPIASATGYYLGALSLKPVSEKAAVLVVTMQDKHPGKAEDALNSLLNVYNQMGLNDKNLVAANTMDFLTDRLEGVEKELRSVEGAVENFKIENRITDITTDAQQYLTAAAAIDQQKAVQETQINIIGELEKELVLNQDNPRMVPSTLGIGEPSLGVLIGRHNELILQRDRMQQKVGTINPALIDLQNQIKDVRISLIENVKNLRNSYNITLNDIERKNAQLNGRIRTMPQLEKNFLQITRDKSVKEQLYLFLLQKREEAAVTLASNIPDSRKIEAARAIGQVAPNRNSIWSMAWALGLLLPIAGLVLVEFMNNKVGSHKEVEQKTRMPLLGDISFIKHLDTPVPVSKGGRSIIAEQFRALRTAISYTGRGEELKTILITSHRPGEGKSFTSLNLAASYALLHKKVVILEFDLRKPRIAKNLGVEGKTGISTYLSREISLDKLLIEIPEHGGDNFFLLPAGPIPPNPAELILSSRMTDLMAELKERFDYILIDTPPFSVVTDATLLQRFVDISIVVLRQGYSFKQVYEVLNQRILQYPDQPLYSILNGIGKEHRYNSYGYGYGYSDGYYDDVKKRNKLWQKN